MLEIGTPWYTRQKDYIVVKDEQKDVLLYCCKVTQELTEMNMSRKATTKVKYKYTYICTPKLFRLLSSPQAFGPLMHSGS